MLFRSYDHFLLRSELVELKKNNVEEETVVLEPLVDLSYEEIVKIMDTVRKIEKTDESIYRKDKIDGDVLIKTLFSKIMFGNIMS